MISSPDAIPAQFERGAASAANALKNFNKTLIAAHVNPDGDAIGATAGMGYIMEALGRDYALYLPDGVPGYLDFVKLPGKVYTSLADLPFTPESAVIVDCSESGRLHQELAEKLPQWPVVNIDHHQCEHGLGTEANFIHTEAAAASQLVAYAAMSLGIPLQGKLGAAVGTGLLTDTGQFRHNNTSEDVFALCALLEANGIHLAGISENLNHAWTLRRLNIWGACFHYIRMAAGGQIAWCLLTREDSRRMNIGKDDLEGFVDVLRGITGVAIGIFAREQEDGTTRFSLRSKGTVNVQEVAKTLGGGGHRNASGIMLGPPCQEAMQKVLRVSEKYLAERLAE